MPGDGFYLHRLLVDNAQPRHLEPTHFNRDAAGFTVELFPASDPNDERVDAAQYRVYAVQASYVDLCLILFGYVLQRAEPSCSAVRTGIPLDWLDALPHMDPCAVGSPQPIFHVRAHARDAGFERFCTKRFTIFRVQDVEPCARRLGHAGGIDANELRQRFRPALERTVPPGDHMSKLRHALRVAKPLFSLLQRALQPGTGLLDGYPLRHVHGAHETRAPSLEQDLVRENLDVNDRSILFTVAPDTRFESLWSSGEHRSIYARDILGWPDIANGQGEKLFACVAVFAACGLVHVQETKRFEVIDPERQRIACEHEPECRVILLALVGMGLEHCLAVAGQHGLHLRLGESKMWTQQARRRTAQLRMFAFIASTWRAALMVMLPFTRSAQRSFDLAQSSNDVGRHPVTGSDRISAFTRVGKVLHSLQQ